MRNKAGQSKQLPRLYIAFLSFVTGLSDRLLDGFMESSGYNISLLFGSKLDKVYCVA